MSRSWLSRATYMNESCHAYKSSRETSGDVSHMNESRHLWNATLINMSCHRGIYIYMYMYLCMFAWMYVLVCMYVYSTCDHRTATRMHESCRTYEYSIITNILLLLLFIAILFYVFQGLFWWDHLLVAFHVKGLQGYTQQRIYKYTHIIYTYIYICMYIYIYMYIHTYVHTYKYIFKFYVFMYIHRYIHIYTHIKIYLYKYWCVYIYKYIYIYMCIYPYMYVYIYIYTNTITTTSLFLILCKLYYPLIFNPLSTLFSTYLTDTSWVQRVSCSSFLLIIVSHTHPCMLLSRF